MGNSKEKKLENQSIFAIISLVLAIIVIVLSCLLIFGNNNNLSSFEQTALYDYLSNSLNVQELYSLSGSSEFDELQYTQSQIKIFLDEYTTKNNTDIIPVSEISIPNSNVDFHGILVSDYEFIPEEDVFKKVAGANSNMKSIEGAYSSFSERRVLVNNAEKLSDNSYSVSFDIVDSSNSNFTLSSGTATIEIGEDNSFEVISCEMN